MSLTYDLFLNESKYFYGYKREQIGSRILYCHTHEMYLNKGI